jgi:hypothetical protein
VSRIGSGGAAPHLFNDDSQDRESLENWQGGGARRLKTLLTIGVSVLLLGLASHLGRARDRGQFANSNPEIKQWFEGLHSGKGPCCSDADGTAISDADWEARTANIGCACRVTVT